MTQPLCKFLLCFGLIAALHQSARMAAAPISQAIIAPAPAELERQYQRLGRDYRIQIYNSFRENRAEYDRRRSVWEAVHQLWQASGGRVETKQAIIRWLHIGIRNSMSGTLAPLPRLSELDGPELNNPELNNPELNNAVTQPPASPKPSRQEPPAASQNLELPRTSQNFSPLRGTINVAPRSREGDFETPRLRPTRPATTPDVSPEGPKTLNRAAATNRPTAPTLADKPSPSKLPTPKMTRRFIVEPRIDELPPRKLTEPILKRGAQPVEPPLQEGTFAKTIFRSSRKTTDTVIPPNHLTHTDRLPVRSRRPAPATAIELPPLAPPSPQAAVEHAQINLIELAAHIAGYDRGLKTLENRLLPNKRWTPGQLAGVVTEFSNLARRRETITLYLRLLTPETRQTMPKLNTASTAVSLLERRIRETRTIINRGSFPAVGNENRLDREILDAVSRKLSELGRPAGQR